MFIKVDNTVTACYSTLKFILEFEFCGKEVSSKGPSFLIWSCFTNTSSEPWKDIRHKSKIHMHTCIHIHKCVYLGIYTDWHTNMCVHTETPIYNCHSLGDINVCGTSFYLSVKITKLYTPRVRWTFLTFSVSLAQYLIGSW